MDVKLLRETFERARKENGGVTALGMRFYARLFEKYPGVKSLFHTPPEEQHKKLMASVGSIVSAVENPSALVPFLHAMGIRHLKYGTENAHYPAVAENLIAVLGEHLSKEGDWTEEMETAWKEALDTVSKIMIEAANNPEQFEEEMCLSGFSADGFRANDPEVWQIRN